MKSLNSLCHIGIICSLSGSDQIGGLRENDIRIEAGNSSSFLGAVSANDRDHIELFRTLDACIEICDGLGILCVIEEHSICAGFLQRLGKNVAHSAAGL